MPHLFYEAAFANINRPWRTDARSGILAVTLIAGFTRLQVSPARHYDTYVFGDGAVNSLTITVGVKLSEAEWRRILMEYGKVLATSSLAINPNSELEVQPIP